MPQSSHQPIPTPPDPTAKKPGRTEVVWQNFSVPFEYPVYFTEQLFSPHNPVLLNTLTHLEAHKTHRIICFIDDGLRSTRPDLCAEISNYCDAHSNSIKLVSNPVWVPGGETIKADRQCFDEVQHLVAEYRLDRHSYVIGIGGGALLDAVGLVAATSHRGIRHIRIPTTVLAQNDSGVGVKNSINMFGQKNYLGTFAPPFAVLNDYDFIRSLPQRDKISGMAEAVKVALIRDALFFRWLEQSADHLAAFSEDAMHTMIKRCAELHMRQIARGGDPFETGSARPLDYGHWIAHKLESLTNFTLRHGEAVAIGLAIDTRYSVSCGMLQPGVDEQVCHLLEKLGFKLWHSALNEHGDNGTREVLNGLHDFREHLGGKLTITLLEDIGVGTEVHEINSELVAQCIQWLNDRHTANSHNAS